MTITASDDDSNGAPPSSADFDERLKAAEKELRPPQDESKGSAMARGMRIGTELVVAIGVGAGLGWLVDQGLNSTPWAMLAGLLLGFVAGLRNLSRAVQVMADDAQD